MSDMQTMPIKDLVKALRSHAKKDSTPIQQTLVFNVLANRLDEQERDIDRLSSKVQNLEHKLKNTLTHNQHIQNQR